MRPARRERPACRRASALARSSRLWEAGQSEACSNVHGRRQETCNHCHCPVCVRHWPGRALPAYLKVKQKVLACACGHFMLLALPRQLCAGAADHCGHVSAEASIARFPAMLG